MKTAGRIAVLFALLAPVTGCVRKAKVTPPPQEQAPVPPLSRMVHLPEFPTLPPPYYREVVPDPPKDSPPPPSAHTKRTTRRKTPKSTDPATTPVPSTTDKPSASQQAAIAPPDASPIGQLSSTGGSHDPQGRKTVELLINTTEKGLTDLKRPLTTDEQATSTQIRTFLQKARAALIVDDLEGAQTLATKAKVLLAELNTK